MPRLTGLTAPDEPPARAMRAAVTTRILHYPKTPVLVLLASLMITAAAWYLSERYTRQTAETRFSYQAEDVLRLIRNRMVEHEVVLRGGVGLVNASEYVSRDEWRRYVASLDLEKNLPGIQGYGYSIFVKPEDRGRHIGAIRNQGFPDYDIKPAGNRGIYTSIIYLEPFERRNRQAFGYDMFSEPVRRLAMERARDSGNAAVSGKVTLVQEIDEDVQPGLLMYLPVYEKDKPLTTVAERRAAIKGYVYSPFRMRDLMAGIVDLSHTRIGFRIYDGTTKSGDALLYTSHVDARTAKASPDQPRLARTASLQLGGHVWTMAFHSRHNLLSSSEANLPVLIAAAGLVITILLFTIMSSLAAQNRNARRLAQIMTSELRKAKIAAETLAGQEEANRKKAERANSELKLANEGLHRFSSIAAHDLRAPLRRIESFVEILREDYACSLGGEGEDIVERIARGSSRMRQMVDSLLNYSKCRYDVRTARATNAAQLVGAVTEALALETADAVLTVDIDPTLAVRGDQALLEHVFHNLICNALKFRSNRPMRIDIAARRVDSGRIEFAVTDNGIGIEPKFAEKIFQMFCRLHDEDEYAGVGIGLSVCQKIITAHGGDIAVDTSHKNGARFVFTLIDADEKVDGEMKEAA